MKRILITGMSGTGKSSVILALAALGYPALDMDEPGCSEAGPDGDWAAQPRPQLRTRDVGDAGV